MGCALRELGKPASMICFATSDWSLKGHAYQSTATPRRGTLVLTPLPATRSRPHLGAPRTPELDELERTGRPISDCSSLGATATLDTRAGVRGPYHDGRAVLVRLLGAEARARDGGPTGFPDRMKTSCTAGSSPRCVPRQGDHPHGRRLRRHFGSLGLPGTLSGWPGNRDDSFLTASCY